MPWASSPSIKSAGLPAEQAVRCLEKLEVEGEECGVRAKAAAAEHAVAARRQKRLQKAVSAKLQSLDAARCNHGACSTGHTCYSASYTAFASTWTLCQRCMLSRVLHQESSGCWAAASGGVGGIRGVAGDGAAGHERNTAGQRARPQQRRCPQGVRPFMRLGCKMTIALSDCGQRCSPAVIHCCIWKSIRRFRRCP